jgi:hypothetical protein
MNQGNWTVLLLGCLLILALYRRAVKSNVTSNLYGPDSGIDYKSQFSYHLVKQQNSGYKKITLACLVSYILILTNIVLDYVPGWWILGAVSFLLTYSYYISGSAANLAYLAVTTDTAQKDKSRSELDALQKSCVKFLVATVVVSGLWFYQVQRNQSAEKLTAINEVTDLVGLEWCAKFSSEKAYMDADGNYENFGYGGWPCLKVESVRNIRFEARKDNLEMCFSYSLSQSDDGPWNRDVFTEYDFRSLCVVDGDFFSYGWDESSLEEGIRENFGDELESLRTRMCSVYGRGMTYDDYSIYCNG